ncbi:hypothetical protein SBA2_230013 [Acidobacteriia bacterium SbA2]|nr:hypothetical protein SBA2_230013 [Acidobacteriia bacterium SbA2]
MRQFSWEKGPNYGVIFAATKLAAPGT